MTVKAQVIAAVVSSKLEHGSGFVYVDAAPRVFARLVVDESLPMKSAGAVLIGGLSVFLENECPQDCIRIIHHVDGIPGEMATITKIGLKDDDVE